MARARTLPTAVFLAVLGIGLWLAACGEDPAPAPTEPETNTAQTALGEAAKVVREYDANRIPHELATNPGTPWGDYVGSQVCKRCHEEEYHKWRKSWHSRTLYDVVDQTVFGDFSGKVIFDLAHDGRHKMWFIVEPFTKPDPITGEKRFYMTIRWRTPDGGPPPADALVDTYRGGLPPDPTGTYEVIYSFGNRRHQPYVARFPDGQHWVLPVFWNDIEKAWRYDGYRPYVSACGGCHVSGIKTADRDPRRGPKGVLKLSDPPLHNMEPENEGWADGAVSCEVCHGPGRHHVREVERLGPTRYAELLEAGEKEPTIWDGRRGPRGTSPEQTFERRLDQCGQCHNFHTEHTASWVPTPQGFLRDANKDPIRLDQYNIRGQGNFQFYGDGSPKSPCTVVAVYRTSTMYEQGVGCWDCHDPHGTDHWADLILPVKNNELCISCHQELESVEAQTAHSRHIAGSPGNRCIECHMPRHLAFSNGVHQMSDRIPRHSFDIPTGIRRPGGPPSACNICHTDRSHEWTREQLALWKAEKPPADEDAGSK